MVIRLLIVDDQQIVRQGLKMFFQIDTEIEIVGEAENGEEAVKIAFDTTPTVILMDILMPIMNGVEAIRIIRKQAPRISIIALTSTQDEHLTHETVLAGADCFVHKTLSPQKLLEIINGIASERVLITPCYHQRFLANLKAPTLPATLAAIELKIMELLGQGFSSNEIRDILQLDTSAYIVLRQELLAKFSAPSQLLLVLYAIKLGLIETPNHNSA